MPPLRHQWRWRILALLFLITVVNFLDRQSLSVVAPVLREEFRLSATDYGRIVAAFQFGMMTGEFPMGWLMDRRGVRFGFTFAVISWSLATAMHVFGRSALTFGLFRFWMGTGECGNFSGGMKVVSQWFPVRERAFAVGIFNSGTMIGAMIAPPLIAFLMLRFGWRVAFLVPATFGFVWVALWRLFYRPADQHPRLSAAELDYIRQDPTPPELPPPPTAALLRRRETWAVMLCRMMVGPVVQFYWYWLPDYLYHARGLSLRTIGLFAWVPFLFGDLGNIGGGWLAGALIRRGFSVDAARRITMFSGAACCLGSLAVAQAPTAGAAIAVICLVLLGHTCLSANMFAVISDFFPDRAVGRVTGLTGVAGGLSGLLFPLLTGVLVDRFSYTPVFALAAAMPLAGVLLQFLLGGRVRRLEI
ncbi:MAG: MFS transporter [Acidobacteriota bacterium]